MNEIKGNIEIYTEYTPNPESLKFVLNRMLLPGNSADFRTKDEAGNSPLALLLFEAAYVQGVFITNNFVTITKAQSVSWPEVIPEIKETIKGFLKEGGEVLSTSVAEVKSPTKSSENPEGIEGRIKELLDSYVRPAVEQDGGAIQFKSFDDGRLTVILQGSCSGCPSATVTLKQGIEGLLNRMIPEVKEVVAEEI